MSAIKHIIDISGLPLFLIAVASFLILIRENSFITIQIIILCLLSISFREVYGQNNILSSRYYLIVICYELLLFAKAADSFNHKKHQIVVIATVTFVIFLQLIRSYQGSRDCYISDAQEIINDRLKDTTVLVDRKEFIRLSPKQSGIEYFEINDMYKTNRLSPKIFSEYSSYYHKTAFVTKEKLTSMPNIPPPPGANITMSCSFHTGKSGKSFLNIYNLVPRPIVNRAILSSNFKNRFINGDFEIIEDKGSVKKKFKKWIDDGCIFYDNDELIFPRCEYLLPTWSTMNPMQYPYVQSELVNPIEGKLSLHVQLFDDSRIYLLNKISTSPGILVFDIKFLTPSSKLTVGRVDYDANGSYHLSPLRFYISSNNFEVQHLSFPYTESDGLGFNKSLFFIEGADCEFIVDNVGYYNTSI